jgi:hypothetical protein
MPVFEIHSERIMAVLSEKGTGADHRGRDGRARHGKAGEKPTSPRVDRRAPAHAWL